MKVRVLSLFALALGATMSLWAEEKPLAVLVASYNNKEYYEKNLNSLFSQEYENFKVIYIDDASEDGTADLVEGYVKERGLEDRLILVRNEVNQGPMANTYHAVHDHCDNHEIVVAVDGDDWLSHNQVFSRINEVYTKQNVWVTYGSLRCYPSGEVRIPKKFNPDDIRHNTYRQNWSVLLYNPRTFYAGLFKKIKKEDLCHEGEFFEVLDDNAIMFPMLEMAGGRYDRIDEVLYVYNRETPINMEKVHPWSYIESINHIIRGRSPYRELTEASF